MLDTMDIDNLEFIGIGLNDTEYCTDKEWFSNNDLDYLNKMLKISTKAEKPDIFKGVIKNITLESDGNKYKIWIVLIDKTKVYVGNLAKYERLKVKACDTIYYRLFNGKYIVCNEVGDTFIL